MGSTVIPGLGPGLGEDINPFDPNYQTLVLRKRNQEIADKWNADQTAKYLKAAADVKANNIQLAAAHQPLLVLDPPPHKQVLDANGNIVSGVELVTTPVSVAPSTPNDAPSVTIASPNAPPDRLDQVIQMLMYMNKKLDQILAK